jgi:GxxExxY protein
MLDFNPKIILPDGLIDCDELLIDMVPDAATNVHRQFGPGLLESVYELALMIELAEMKIPAERQY